VGWRFTNPRLKKEWTISLGETAEVVAQRYKITRTEQDAFAVESQRRAEAALKACVFTDELVPVPLSDGTAFAKDEYPRAGTTLESVAKLKPAFQKDGTVTAASSSGINDGAAALLVMGKGGKGGAEPLARVVATAVAGVDPSCMGLGPIPATQKVLKRAGSPRPNRFNRAERGLRGAGDRLHPRAAARPGQGEPLRRRDRAGPSTRRHGCERC